MGMNIDTAAITNSYARLTLLGTNISNQNTIGYKSSSFSNMLGQASNGNGQDFKQGDIAVDNKPLNVAINGSGFFKLKTVDPKTGLVSRSIPEQFTRDGQFMLNGSNYLVNASGNYLMDASDKPILIAPTLGAIESKAGKMQLNLDSGESVPKITPFSASDSNSYNKSSATTIFDAEGKSSTVNTYFVKTAANKWDVYTNVYNPKTLISTTLSKDASLTFNTNGALTAASGTGATFVTATNSFTLKPKDASNVSFDVSKPTETSSYYGNSTKVDGSAQSQFLSCTIGADGAVLPTYSNNGTNVTPLAFTTIKLYKFPNNNGLQQSGVNTWTATNSSGEINEGEPGSPGFGYLQAGATEGSNVDATKAMIDLLSAQRAFQAESQVVNTQSQILQEVAQLGR